MGKIFFRYSDFFVASFSALITNLTILTFFAKYEEPLYFHPDEFMWLRLISHCGGEFPFYEQEWGLIVPLLCLIYPLKLIIPVYYFSLLRPVFLFFDMYLSLKVLRLIFSRKVALIIFFFEFSHIFSLFKFFITKDVKAIIGAGMHSTLRIFNPIYFMAFFLIFIYYFLSFLDGAEKWKYNPAKYNKEKILSGIFLGISFYSQTHWAVFTLSIFIFFVLIMFFLERKNRLLIKEIISVLILGIIVGIPAILFNFYQKIMLSESTLNLLVILNYGRNLDMLAYPLNLGNFITPLFLLALVSFIFSRRFSAKYIFIFSGFLGGYLLFFVEYILGIFIANISMHIVYPFKLMVKIGIGLLIDKIEEIKSERKINVLGVITSAIAIFMFLAFVCTKLLSFYYSISHFPVSYEKLENFKKIVHWLKNNSSRDSVITHEDFSFFFPSLYEPIGTPEIIVSVASERFALYNDSNIIAVTDLNFNDIFNRFILRSKVLGYSENELERYIREIAKSLDCPTTFPGLPQFCVQFALMHFGEPPDFKFPRDIHKDAFEVLDDFIKVTLRYYQDETYFKDLIKRYKIDYVVRRKEYQGEWYLKQEAKIGEFYIFRVIRENKPE
jgi:hypothetical protein